MEGSLACLVLGMEMKDKAKQAKQKIAAAAAAAKKVSDRDAEKLGTSSKGLSLKTPANGSRKG